MKKTIIRITGIMKHRNGKKSEYWTIHMRKAILIISLFHKKNRFEKIMLQDVVFMV